MKNKVLAMLLALCMVMSLLPVSVFATDAGVGACACTADHSTDENKGKYGDGPSESCHSSGSACGVATTGYKKFCDDCVGTEQTQLYACNCTGCSADGVHEEGHDASTYTLTDAPGKCTACNSYVPEDEEGDEAVYCECGCPITGEATDCCSVTTGEDGEPEYTCGCTGEGDDFEPCGGALCTSEACNPNLPDCACSTHVDNGKLVKCEGKAVINGLCRECAEAKHETGVNVVCTSADTEGACLLTKWSVTTDADDEEIEHKADCIESCLGAVEAGEDGTPAPTCTATKHKDDCPVGQAEEELKEAVEAGTAKVATVKVTLELTCDCTHTHVNGAHSEVEIADHPCTNKVKVEAELTFPYDVEKAEEAGKAAPKAGGVEEDDEAGEAESVYGTYEEALKIAKGKKLEELDAEDNFCADCKAYIAANDCTGAWNCNKAAHKADCLSLCKFSKACTASNHQVLYVVVGSDNHNTDETAFHSREEAVEYVNGQIEDARTARDTAKDALDEAQAILDDLIEAAGTDAEDEDDGEEGPTVEQATATVNLKKTLLEAAEKRLKDELQKYTIVEKHCPSQGIPDSSTVVSVEEADAAASGSDKTDAPKAPEKAEDFADVPAGAWYAEELTALVEKGIFKGILDTEAGVYNFEPKTEIETPTVVALIARVLGKDIKDGEGSAWAQPYLDWAAEAGVSEGVDTGKITRSDVALMLWRAADKPEPSEETSLEAFEDVAELEGDALTAMKWAYEVGIFKGDAGAATMRPAAVLNRAEMVAVIARFDGVVNK